MSSTILNLTEIDYDFQTDFFVLAREGTPNTNWKTKLNNFTVDNTNSFYGLNTAAPAQTIDVNSGIIQSRRTVAAASANNLTLFSMGYNKDAVDLDVISNYVFNVESINATTDCKFHIRAFEATGAYGNIRDLDDGTFFDTVTIQKTSVGIGTTSPSASYRLDIGDTGFRSTAGLLTGTLSANALASTTSVTGATGTFTGTLGANALTSTTSVSADSVTATGNISAARLLANTATTTYRVNVNGGIGLGLAQAALPQIQILGTGFDRTAYVGYTNDDSRLTLGLNGRRVFSGGFSTDITLYNVSFPAMVIEMGGDFMHFMHATAGANPRTPVSCMYINSDGNTAFGQTTVTSGYKVEVDGKIKADNLPDDLVNAGSYTPTITNVSNVNAGASVASGHRWIRIDEMVFVTGSVTFTPSGTATTFVLRITLPIASNFNDVFNLTGACTGYQSGVVLPATNPAIATCSADTTNDEVTLSVLGIGSVGTSDNVTLNYSFSYVII